VKIREELVAAGKAPPYHIPPETGWLTFYLRGPADVAAAIAPFQANYERLSNQSGARALAPEVERPTQQHQENALAQIAIIGAGAIGGTVAALLHRAGHQVTLIVRPESLDSYTAGLRIDGVLGAWSAPVPAATAIGGRPDLALLAVKTQDVVAAIERHRRQLVDVPLVTMQNGVRSDDLVANYLPPAQILSAVVFIIATSLTPGAVTIAAPGALVVGRPFAPTQPVDAAMRILRDAVPTTASHNIQGAHWLKLLVNLNNAVPALVDRPLQTVAADPFLRQVMLLLMREGMATVSRARIRLESLPGAPVGLIRLLTLLPLGLAGAIVQRQLRRTSSLEVLGSTLQSLRRGRPSEIAYLNGEVVRLGQQVGVPTPLNAAVVALVGEVERSGQFFTPGAVQKQLASIIRRG
jgi:2-dehydropantoate 2-reductase